MKEYIERDAVLEAIKEPYERVYGKCVYKPVEDVYRMIVKRINNSPAVDVAPVVHGEWIDIISHEDIIYATCNHCHSRGKVKTNRNEWGTWYIDSPYCPKCGARMDGGKK